MTSSNLCVAGTTEDSVIAQATDQSRIAASPLDVVVAATAPDEIVSASANYRALPRPGINGGVAVAYINIVGAIRQPNAVTPCSAKDNVIRNPYRFTQK